jgi:hypothetical protein
MPKADKLTAIREACDLDCELAEETAWATIARMGWIATPQLLYAALERARVITEGPEYTDWYTLKARTSDE